MKNIILLLLLISSHCGAKVLLMTHSFNRPDFIELQAKTFKAFIQDSYEYVVFNDASNEDMKNQIEQTCKKLGVRCFRVPQNLHVPGRQSPGDRHIHGIAYALQQIGYEYDGIVTLIDSDCFLLKPFSIEKHLAGYDISGELQGRENDTVKIRHLSPVLVFMNMQKLPNKQTLSFEGGFISGLACDVGAHTYYYLKNNPSVRALYFTLSFIPAIKLALNCVTCKNLSCNECSRYLQSSGFDSTLIRFIQSCPDDNMEFVLNNTFLHYRCGSNWNNKPAAYHIAKGKALNDLITDLLYDHYYHLHALQGVI